MIEIGYAGPIELRWAEGRLGLVLTRNARGIAAWRKSEIVGVVAYDQWTHNGVQAHMVVDEPIAWRRLLPHVFKAPFETRGVLVGVIESANTRSRALAERFGFRLAHTIQDGHSVGNDLLIYEMRREECRYLGGTNG